MTKNLNDDRFLKWRCLVALAHADGKVTSEEIKILESQFAQAGLTPVQREILEEDIRKPQDSSVLFGKISSEVERTDLIHRAHLLFWSDGEFHEAEKRAFEVLKDKARSGYVPLKKSYFPFQDRSNSERPLLVGEFFRVMFGKLFSWIKASAGGRERAD